MAFSLPANTNGTQEARRGNRYSHIRVFTVGTSTPSKVPLPDLQTVEQPWREASMSSLYSGKGNGKRNMFRFFSSVCWFFGKEIADRLDNLVPIGLISNNAVNSPIDQWLTDGSLYHSMIYPYTVGPMAISGIVWYHGESHAHTQEDARAYARKFPRLIQSWRDAFGIWDLYFGFVQLATGCNQPALALLRDSQLKTMTRAGGKIAYATNADRGDGCNLHPPSKQDCGRRLARSALALQYGKSQIRWKSPTYQKAFPSPYNSKSIIIQFRDVSFKGLELSKTPYSMDPNRPTAEPKPSRCQDLKPGTCAGAQVYIYDYGWVNATLRLHGTHMVELIPKLKKWNEAFNVTIVVTSYGWAPIPLLTVYDKATNLPVLPWKSFVTPLLAQNSQGDHDSGEVAIS
jgi:Carbohydrate esterase, sialic acid-specific acetylesterase